MCIGGKMAIFIKLFVILFYTIAALIEFIQSPFGAKPYIIGRRFQDFPYDITG